MENPLISLDGQEKSSRPKPTIAIFSRKIQHKIFWDVFVTSGEDGSTTGKIFKKFAKHAVFRKSLESSSMARGERDLVERQVKLL